ncbi:MAG: choice-of-anchor Q domain-containing protein [Microscillaceae bacterium]|nr:choice-of-anchor Q domain-containing protein [Microscillaceae bacterium]
MFKYKFLLLTLTLSTIFCIRSIAKDFYITNGNVYGTNGLVEAIRAAKDNNDLINTIHLANGGSYVLDRIIEEAPEGLGPNGLPVWRTDSNTNKVLIFKGNGATISRSASAPIFRMMFVYNHADVQADNVTFANFRTNTRGGGVFYIKYGGTGKFTNCKFPNNQTVSISALYGGSLFIDILGSLEIDQCEFTDNRCWGEGGAVYCVGSDLKVTNSTFLRNKSLNPTSNNNDYYVNGGAIQVDGVNNERTKKVTISNCVFDSNEVGDQGKEQGGGAVFIFLYDDQQFEMDRCTFKNNKSGGFGGGLSASATLANPNAYIKITNSVFHNNRTEGQGGAMWMICKKADIVNCTVSQNYSDEYGGGIAIINQGKTVVKHCTIDNNDCRLSGGGLFCSERSLELYNSIVAFNTIKGANYIAANCREFYQGSGNIEYPQIINNVNAVNCGSNVTIADPKLLALADNGGGTMTKALSATSPAINKANNSFTTPTDQRGTNRQGLPDIGAYEYSTTSTTPPDVIGAGVTINKLVLINTATGQAVSGHDPLLSGAQINLATVDPSQLSIQAFTSSAPQKVNFNLAGAATWNQTEGAAPYFLFGDVNASGSPWKATVPKAGDNFTLTVTPYNLDGTAGLAQVVSFSFVNTTAPPPPPTSTAPIVNSVSVINTLTNQPIPGYENLQDGTQFNLTTLPTTKISFKVNTSNTGSVDLNLSGSATWQQVESVQPFAMFGDNANGLIPWPIKPIAAGDNYKLVITPYSGAGKLGTKGAVKEINFTFVSGEVTPPPPPPSSGLSVSSMTLINALTDQEIKTLQNDETIDLASLPTDQLNIRANVSGGTAGSVVLESFGTVNSLRNENGAPYAMFGDVGGDYYGQTFSAGQYTFKATPYSQLNSSGDTGTALTLNITFTNNINRVAASPSTTLQNNLEEKLNVYPNPVLADGQLTIANTSQVASKVSAVILDRLGKTVYSGEQMLEVGQNAEIDLSKLSLQKGTYTLSYHNGTEKVSKVIIIR